MIDRWAALLFGHSCLIFPGKHSSRRRPLLYSVCAAFKLRPHFSLTLTSTSGCRHLHSFKSTYNSLATVDDCSCDNPGIIYSSLTWTQEPNTHFDVWCYGHSDHSDQGVDGQDVAKQLPLWSAPQGLTCSAAATNHWRIVPTINHWLVVGTTNHW